MVFGTTLKIPSEFFAANNNIHTDSEFATNLREAMRCLRPTETAWHGQRGVFVHPDLRSCQQVFVRNDSIRPSLSAPYAGPYEVVSRNDKHFKVSVNGRMVNISIDRLKPAYTAEDQQQQHQPELGAGPASTESSPLSTRTTRSGRRVTIPLRYR